MDANKDLKSKASRTLFDDVALSFDIHLKIGTGVLESLNGQVQ